MKVRSYLIYIYSFSVLCLSLYADDVESKKSAMMDFAKQVTEKDGVKVEDNLSLSCFAIFNDEDEGKTYLPLAVNQTSDSICEVKNVFVFNTRGEGFELQKVASYGESAEGRSVKVDLWSTDLLAGGNYTPYIYWSTVKNGGICKFTAQSLPMPDLTRMLEDLRAAGEDDGRLATRIRSCGNLRLSDSSVYLINLLVNSTDQQTKEACLVSIAKIGLSDEVLLKLLNERNADNASELLTEIRTLKKVFRENASAEDMLEVGAVENNEAKTWAILRLAYLGEKDLAGKIPIGISWGRLIGFKMAITALADEKCREKNE